MPLLSIIIPVYNVENYLDECLQSIVNQSFNDYEVILVDDASTDRSGKICDEYALKYCNIKVIHLKVNSLLGAARNIGLENATGEYIHFCDADDFYIKDSFLNIADNLKENNSDVILGHFICKPEKGAFFCNDVELSFDIFKNAKIDLLIECFLKKTNILGTAWRFIIKRKFLLSNNIIFPVGCYAEDELWFPQVICDADKFSEIKNPFYCYRPRASGSITSTKTYLHSKSQLLACLNLLRFLIKKKYKDRRLNFICCRVNMLMGIFATRCDTFDKENLKELSKIIDIYIEEFKLLGRISQQRELFDFVNRYGSYLGICLYRTYVIEKTLEIVHEKESKDIYIFPTGYNGEGTARILKNAGYKVKGFLDNAESKNGTTIDNLPVRLPSILNNISKDKLNNIFILVTVQQSNVSEIIKNQLRSLGIEDHQFASRIY